MIVEICYVAELSNGNTFLGTLKSIKRITKNLKTQIVKKAPSASLAGQELFICAKNRLLKKLNKI